MKGTAAATKSGAANKILFIHGKSLLITVYVLEDMSKRSYSTGGQFGMTHVVSSNTQYQTISGMIVHEKQMGAMKTNKAYILMKFLLLQDGTIKVSQNTIDLPPIKRSALGFLFYHNLYHVIPDIRTWTLTAFVDQI